MKKVNLLLSMIMIMAVVLAACAPAPTDEPPAPPDTPADADADVDEPDAPDEPAEPIVLRIGITADVDCWNPYACDLAGHYPLLYDSFTALGAADEGCPGIQRMSHDMEISADALTYTYYMHPGMSYSDGEPFDANTMVAYWDWFLSTSMIWWAPENYSIVSYEAIDDLTFTYTTSQPFVDSQDDAWIWQAPAPPHIWGDFTEDDLWGYYPELPVTNGPYFVSEHVPGSYFILDAHPNYSHERPVFDRLVFQVFANEEALAAALIAGDIDITTRDMGLDTLIGLEGEENVTVVNQPPGSLYHLYFNMAAEGVKHPAINDLAVRQAIDQAIDKQHIVDVALQGRGLVCANNWGCGPNYTDRMSPNIVLAPFDPTAANAILDTAGYVDTDGDGVRETADGDPLEFRLLTQVHRPIDLSIGEMIAVWLADIGITVVNETVDPTSYQSLLKAERDYDMTIWVQQDNNNMITALDWTYSCASADLGIGGGNRQGYCNPDLDALQYAASISVDPEERLALVFEAQELLFGDVPEIVLAGQNVMQAYRSDWLDFPVSACDVGDEGLYSIYGLLNAVVK